MKSMLMLMVLLLLLVPVTVAQEEVVAPLPAVQAVVETVPSPSNGASDVAIWLHPTDLAESTILGADDQGGLMIYDLNGEIVQMFEGMGIEGLDLRYNVPLDGGLITLVAAGVANEKRVLFYRVDPASRRLQALNEATINVRVDSLCLYRSAATEQFYMFITTDYGVVEQYELAYDGTAMQPTQVRQFNVGGELEGCVADDSLGQLYITEQEIGLWKYGAEPDAGLTRRLVDMAGGAHLSAEVEGLALYSGAEDSGYLVVSNQGSNNFAVYDRQGDNAYLGAFEIVASDAIDEIDRAAGLDIANMPLGTAFGNGLLVVSDNFNGEENRNFKLLDWGSIATSLNLTVDTSFDPQMVGR